MLDHVGLDVSDYGRSKAFYEKTLAPLGLKLMMEPAPGIGGFGDGQKPFFWIGTRGRSTRAPPTTVGRVCVRSTTRTTTAPSCSTPTETTSRRCAMSRRSAPSGGSALSQREPARRDRALSRGVDRHDSEDRRDLSRDG
jgi:hypothetical protein